MLKGFRSRIYGIPRSLPWMRDHSNDPTPGTSGAAAAPSLGNNSNTNEGVRNLEVNNENSASSLEDAYFKAYRDRGHSPDEAEEMAAKAAGVPPKSLRARMGWFADAEPGSISALEMEMWHSFRQRGHSAEESARLARAWVSR